MTALSIENLYGLSDDQVKATVHSVFLQQLKTSPSVRQVFFANVGNPPAAATDPGWVDDVATALVCSGIARSSLWGFSETVKKDASDAFWSSRLSDSNASSVSVSQALYDWAFPSYCSAGGVTFQQYLHDNPTAWGRQLAARVTDPSFINTEINKIIAADPGWLQKLNLVFYKLHRLDDSTVAGVVSAWSQAFPGKHITNQWNAYNFVPSDLFQPDLFLTEVNSAISVKTEQKGYAGGLATRLLPGAPVNINIPVTDLYGLGVLSFLGGKPASLGLTTGKAPQNSQSSAGCFVAGTPVLQPDGGSFAIESATEDLEVLTKDGGVAWHSDELVITEIDRETPVYGFNDMKPFFNAGHAFWTREGWKALDPAAAREDNPRRVVGALGVGDVVFRVRDLQPFAYEEVTIHKLTVATIPAGSRLYGLHLLDGHRSYHAHGFCVAMNYPVITEKRLRDGFARLTEAERRLLARKLQPLLGMLTHAVGGFLEKPLMRALSGGGSAKGKDD